MSLVARKRARKTVYYVVIQWKGQRYSENAGTDKREAARLNERRERERRAGTYSPPSSTVSITVAQYAAIWLAKRTNRSLRSDRQRMRDHVLSREWLAEMAMADVRARHSLQLIQELNTTCRSHKLIVNVFALFSRMMRDALLEEVIERDPCTVPRGAMRGAPSEHRSPYVPEDAAALCRDDRVQLTVRLWCMVGFLTGMREGEIAGLNWADWQSAEPLSALLLSKQYSGAPLKTAEVDRARPRVVPVHPVLAAELERWRSGLWQLVVGRAPRDHDPICPTITGRRHSRTTPYKAVESACHALGVNQSALLHSMRHSFASWAKRQGAATEWLERVTHNARASRDALDGYLHPEWANLCDVVERAGRVLSPLLSGTPKPAETATVRRDSNPPAFAETSRRNDDHRETAERFGSAKHPQSRAGAAEPPTPQHSASPGAWALAYAFLEVSRRAAA